MAVVERIWIALAGASGVAAVAGDAAGRHLLAGDTWRLELVATAARYGLLHAVAVIGVAALARGSVRGAARLWLVTTGWCFVAGLVLFCGSLYLRAAEVPVEVGRATPIGGVFFIAGWAALLIHAATPGRRA